MNVTNCTLYYVYGNDEQGYYYRYKNISCHEDGTFCIDIPNIIELSDPIQMRYRTIPDPLRCFGYLVSCIEKRDSISDEKCWFVAGDFDNDGKFAGIIPEIKDNHFIDRFPNKNEVRIMNTKVVFLYIISILVIIFVLTRI